MKQSDIYQLGLLFFRLLGGFLSYDGTAWLNKKELSEYQGLSDFDAQIVLDAALEKRITSGKLVNLDSLPPWSGSEKIRRFIKKATHPNPLHRFSNSAEFLTSLQKIRALSIDWKVDTDSVICNLRGTTYKIALKGDTIIQKRRAGNWQVVRTFKGDTLAESVAFVCAQ